MKYATSCSCKTLAVMQKDEYLKNNNMEIFTNCIYCNVKIKLDTHAINRSQLANEWGEHFVLSCPNCHQHASYLTTKVFAENNSKSAPAGAIIGGLIGLIFGPEGAFIGSAIGGAGGLSKDEENRKKVERFNNSL